MSLSADFPTTRPSLLLDFVNTQALDPRITFTRASSATYFDAAGVLQTAPAGQARFDYNPSTFAPLGLLIEEQRVNSLLQSGWAGAVAGTPGTAPTSWTLGNTGGSIDSVVADILSQNTITMSATNNRQFIQQASISVAANTSYYCSCYVVSNSGLPINQLIGAVNAPAGATTNTYLINGVVTANPNVAIPVAGDRIAVLVVVSSTAGTMIFRAGVGVSGNVTGTIGLKWPQVEAGAFATSYIPTVASSVTRNADLASMTGVNFSSWFNQAAGTLYAEASIPGFSASSVQTHFTASINDGTTSNRTLIRAVSNGLGGIVFDGQVISGGVASFDSNDTLGAANTPLRQALAYQVNDFAQCANGGTVSTDNSGVLPLAGNLLSIGVGVPGGTPQSQNIRRIAYYPFRLTNAQLQALTS